MKLPISFWMASVVFLWSLASAPAQLTITTTNEQGALPLTPTWAPAAHSLIAGLTPSSSSGNFSLEASGRNVNSLTSGGSLVISQIAGNTTSTNYVTCGNGGGAGSLIVYTLPASANGFSLTNITVYGGWKDNGRDQQAYTVYYATAATPANFILLGVANYTPSVPANTASATRVAFANPTSGVIASNVAAIKFDFTTPASENGYLGYGAITVGGTNSAPPAGPPVAATPVESPANAEVGIAAGTTVTLSGAATGAAPIGYQWQTDGGSGASRTNIPGATSSALVVSTTGLAYGTYRYDYVASNPVGTNTSSAVLIAIVAMVDLGASAPIPGPQDITQLLNTTQSDDGLNYYTDNGAAYGHWCGQSFTTGTNQNGFVLQTLAWKSAGNGASFGTSQLYDLYFYSISSNGAAATVIAIYQGDGGGAEGDWFQWQGLSVPLAPNQTYGYAFGNDASASGYEHIGDQGGNPYPGGQIFTVANTAGTVSISYGNTGATDATFDLGFAVYTQSVPFATTPTFTPNTGPIYAGTAGNITLNEAALGAPPFTCQWLTDNGTGGALAPIGGATGTNLPVNVSALAAGNYNYAVVVHNASGASTSGTLTLNILGATAPSLVADITPAPANAGVIGQTVTYSATFTGTPPIGYQWYLDSGNGPAAIAPSVNGTATNNRLVIANLQLTNAGVYSLTAQNSAGSASSSSSTLVVTPPAGTLPPAVTLPPVTLSCTPLGANLVDLNWSQGTLLQSTNLTGAWMPMATSLPVTNILVASTNSAIFYKVAVTSQPRIVNFYCFVRDQDYRTANSQQILYETTAQQLQLITQANLPATFALQYDALMDTNYQALFKTQLPTNIEIAAWYEIPQELVQAAGLTWQGSEEWVSTANIDFSCGYTPAERMKLVDTYMAGFKSVFGYYPRTVGSWYIDEVSLAYMAAKYGIVASCNCKDQTGTDTYTMWGGYWNQAYYPSAVNAYMPAQTSAGQINVPVFRMLGSDPIYQYGNLSPGVVTLEPVYLDAGGSADWVAWFMNNLISEPSLAFGYTQAGQENDIDGGWSAMGAALTRQVALFQAQAQAGQIQMQTLAQSGQWFRTNYPLTPPTSVVALDDWQNEGHKAVWYDSRFYRLNILWTNSTFYIRDLHCFDQNVVSATFSNVLATTYFDYETLPVMDGGLWAASGTNTLGMWPVLLSASENSSPLTNVGPPMVTESSPTTLSIQQPLSGGGTFSIQCTETNVSFTGLAGTGHPLNWGWDLDGGTSQASVVLNVTSNTITFSYSGFTYYLRPVPNEGTFKKLSSGDLLLSPNSSGKLVLSLDLTQ